MKAVVNGGGGNGIFATTADANDGMVAAASTTAGQLRTTAAITAATISQRNHCRLCNCVIAPPSHCRLRQQRLPLMKTTIVTAAINRCFH
jgi:hypothetical protein